MTPRGLPTLGGNAFACEDNDFLVHLDHLKAAFRQHFYRLLKEHDWPVDPVVWTKEWNVHLQPVGAGVAAVKYLGTYVARTAIRDERLVAVDEQTVTFWWKNREHDRREQLTLPGIEFVRRYLRHVLPQGMHSVRYYGFCHPAAKANRLRVQCHSGLPVQLGAPPDARAAAAPVGSAPPCPHCRGPTRLIGSVGLFARKRGPPGPPHRPPTQRPSALPQLAA